MVIDLFRKKIFAGGCFPARLFYTLLFILNLCFCSGFQTKADENSFSFNDLESFFFKRYNSVVELEVVLLKNGNNTLPSSFSKYIVEKKGNSILFRIPEEEEPEIVASANGLTIRLGRKEITSDSVFVTKEVPSYPLGPGDVLLIEIYGIEELKNEVTVDPQGSITLPILDRIYVAGLTIDQLQDKLKRDYSEYINDPQINIQLKEYGSRYVNVMGEVGNPSRIALKRALKLLDAISLAGGFTDKSGDIELQRKDEKGVVQKRKILKDSLLSANSEDDNLYLLDGDVINVMPVSSVYLSGEVKTPQAIMYEKELTLLKAVAKAGGFTQWANKSSIVILRKTGEKTETIKVDASKIEKGKAEDPKLYPSDYIIVKERKLF
jgi:polysaccharide export outer membrane protein